MSLQDALDYCLENPEGLSAPELLSRFPQFRAELEPLLALGSRVRSVSPPPVGNDRREAMKARLMQAAAASRPTEPVTAQLAPEEAAAPALDAAPALVEVAQPPRKWGSWLAGLLRRPAFVAAAVGLLLVATVWPASASSLPDSPLYGVKLGTENLLLNFAGSVAERVRQHAEIANNRLFDLRAMQERDKLAQSEPAFSSYSYHLGRCFSEWQSTTGEVRTELARMLYVTSVAGEKTFAGFGDAVQDLPEALQSNIEETVGTIDQLSSSTETTLQGAGVDLDALLREAGSSRLGALITPVPTVPDGEPTSPTLETPAATPSLQTVEATETAQPATATALAETPSGVPEDTAEAARSATPDPSDIGTPGQPTRGTPSATDTPVPALSDGTRTPTRPAPTATSPPAGSDSSRPATAPPPTAGSNAVALNVCSLEIDDVTAVCAQGNCVRWSAAIGNKSEQTVEVAWVALLQYHERSGGQFVTAATQSGVVGVPPEGAKIGGTLCLAVPPGANSVRVQLVLDTARDACSKPKPANSEGFSPCSATPDTGASPTPQGSDDGEADDSADRRVEAVADPVAKSPKPPERDGKGRKLGGPKDD